MMNASREGFPRMVPSRSGAALVILALCSALAASVRAAPTHDADGNGYVDTIDYQSLHACLIQSGPGAAVLSDCQTRFDDGDGDVDLADVGAFQRAAGHLPIPLRDVLGNSIYLGSTVPYSPRQTCGTGGCHDIDLIANGEWFQQGRTDTAGNVDMRDDYDGDGKYWIKSAGRYGKWGQSFQFLLAAKDNTHPSQIDQTAFAWIRDCSGCHGGGGPGEIDRDDQKLYDAATGVFGYENLGKSAEDVALDGDYSVRTASGTAVRAPWERTGLSEPDCLLCHRVNRPRVGGVDMMFGWRRNTQLAADTLVDETGSPVPAFLAASTAGQGWFVGAATAAASDTPTGPPHGSSADAAFMESFDGTPAAVAAAPLTIDYGVGVANGSLVVGADDTVMLSPHAVAEGVPDVACVACHPLATVAGEVWFDSRDNHYKKFNRLNDDDPSNDIAASESTVCTVCHITGMDHNAGKGNSFQLKYRDELDWANFRSCRECHLTELPNREPNPLKHPEAPDVPGTALIHQIGFYEGENGPMRSVSCQGCHVPYALAPGVLFRDITMPPSAGTTAQYLSADPLDPSAGDKSRWFPPMRMKPDSDGVMRLFPVSVWINIYFGDWNQNGTPEDLSDDVIAPIPTWRTAQALVGVTPAVDDDGDGRPEINRAEEIDRYLEALKGPDGNGAPVASRPVLVRGPRVWYQDTGAPDGITSFVHEGTGIPMTPYPYIWGMDHNALPAEESWGYDPLGGQEGCRDCHRPDTLDSPVFDRKVLIDPFDPNGVAEYTTVRAQTGLNPP